MTHKEHDFLLLLLFFSMKSVIMQSNLRGIKKRDDYLVEEEAKYLFGGRVQDAKIVTIQGSFSK